MLKCHFVKGDVLRVKYPSFVYLFLIFVYFFLFFYVLENLPNIVEHFIASSLLLRTCDEVGWKILPLLFK